MRSKLITMLEEHIPEQMDEIAGTALRSFHFGLLCEVLDRLDETILFQSDIHGVTHVERVCIHGVLLANALGLSPEDSKLLLTACAFHDIGRVDEGTDSGHGRRAAVVLDRYVPNRGEELEILKAAIEAHSESDRFMKEIIGRYGIQNTDRALLIAKLLKDADCLDRVRIHDLDPSYLRFRESLAFVSFAEELFWMYQ